MQGFGNGFRGYQGNVLGPYGEPRQVDPSINRFFQRFSQIPDQWQSPFATMYRQPTTPSQGNNPALFDMQGGYGSKYGANRPTPPQVSQLSTPTPNPQPSKYNQQSQSSPQVPGLINTIQPVSGIPPPPPTKGNSPGLRPFNIQPEQMGGSLGNVPVQGFNKVPWDAGYGSLVTNRGI